MTTTDAPRPRSPASRPLLRRARTMLPTGDTLAPTAWQSRHRWIIRILWAHVAVLPLYGLRQGQTLTHSLLEGGVTIALLAIVASSSRLSYAARSLVATLGLVTSSAVLVHLSGGLIEMHFHFFVVVVLVSLYQSWRPFVVALGVVVLHHGVAGTLDPAGVYNHPAAIAMPWVWALVHAGFILAISAACLVAWRLNEDLIGQERDARDELAAAQRLAGIGSWEWDLATDRLSWSDELHRILGIDPDGPPTISRFLDHVLPDDRERVTSLIATARSTGGDLDYECRIVRPDGTERTVHALGYHVATGSPGATSTKLIGTVQDVTERDALQREIAYRAFYDGLTGLANRALFVDRLEHTLAVSRRSAAPISVLYVDLDGFKDVNDTFGHRAGDELLVEVGRRLLTTVRDGDTVARLAGDEFALILEGADANAAAEVAGRILAALATPVVLGQRAHTLSASIGIADTVHASVCDELLHHADVAMYAAKRHPLGAYELFHPDMADLNGREADLKRELKDAVAQDQLVLHYQPIIDLETEVAVGIEALVRWDHPRYGLLSPTEFIGLAERTGYIVQLGGWVIGEATRRAAELQVRLGLPVHVSVNVAAQQLDGDLVGMVEAALDAAVLPPTQLTLELTETCLMSRHEDAVAKLETLRATGVRIAVDDFGTGYSSLAYLKQLPIDILKIDRAFIQSVAESPEEAGLAHAIIELAGIFGMSTVAEGVETAEQAATLRTLGCQLAQGYLFSRPVPAAEVLDQRWTTPLRSTAEVLPAG